MSGIGAPLSGGLVWQPSTLLEHRAHVARHAARSRSVAPPAPSRSAARARVVPIEHRAGRRHAAVPVGVLALTQELIVATSAALSGGLPAGGIGASVLVIRTTARCANVALGSANDLA